jgi:hypothetical protein
LKTVRGILELGATGGFFGRDIFQTDNMPDLLQRMRSILAGNGLRKDHDL